jgi:hypothetical protein
MIAMASKHLPIFFVAAMVALSTAAILGAPLRLVAPAWGAVLVIAIVAAKIEDRRIRREEAAASGLRRHINDATPPRRSTIGGGR